MAAGDVNTAEHLLRDALAASKRQGACGWQLRIAISLAELQRDQGEIDEAHATLASATAQLREGAGTADSRRAAALLASLNR